MAMDLSPQRLREVQFAEVWRGYRMDQVREFLDEVADAFERLEARARHAEERAATAEGRLVERAASDEVSRTLVLAQRTADAALREAEAESARMLGDAEERSRGVLAEVEARAEQKEREMQARADAELRQLHERRAALEADVALLADYVERQRGALAEELRHFLQWLDRGGHLDAPPAPRSADGADTVHNETALTSSGEGSSPAVAAGKSDVVAPSGATASQVAAPGEVANESNGSEGSAQGGGDPSEDRASTPADPTSEGGDEPQARDAAVEQDEALTADVTGSIDDDPFLAELRRAVEDPEPLGPRDDDAWTGNVELYDQDITGSGRFRRRRR